MLTAPTLTYRMPWFPAEAPVGVSGPWPPRLENKISADAVEAHRLSDARRERWWRRVRQVCRYFLAADTQTGSQDQPEPQHVSATAGEKAASRAAEPRGRCLPDRGSGRSDARRSTY